MPDTAVRTHRIAVVRTDDELIAVCLPYLREGLAAGDLVVALLAPAPAAHVRDQLPGVLVVDYPAATPREPETVAAHTELLAQATAEGRRLRLLGQVRERQPRAWDERLRGEIAHQHLWADAAMASLCVYDRRVTPPEVLATALLAHPEVLVDGAVRVNDAHRPPAELMAALPVPAEPVQQTTPVLAVDGARSLPELRHALQAALAGRLGSPDLDEDVHLAASEIAANAFRHGGDLISARVWADGERVVVTISDSGTRFDGCLSGFAPAHGADLSRGGMGLWLARKLCDHVDTWRGPEGFTVRLTTAVRS
ncbi:Anti-sigma regulatory factor (Ser/Thr protein kinase) [Klenkia soli]|uniref:Anti-sigma regulatory factor (Ser/Thr protein kinase) n=1 Tax=Klenkia soli TaxID=1052260 RepID=A0A1H0QVF1_9ACTN|nr:ATP-binding protein [Klenkia soli]SDP21252.1 Anti-sigma regulatory factor (Ser/Thr protein kinase) [Klenkia soli]